MHGYQNSTLKLVSEYLPLSIKILLCGVQSFFFSYVLVAILLRWSELICTHVEKILDVCLLRCHLQSLQGRGGTN